MGNESTKVGAGHNQGGASSGSTPNGLHHQLHRSFSGGSGGSSSAAPPVAITIGRRHYSGGRGGGWYDDRPSESSSLPCRHGSGHRHRQGRRDSSKRVPSSPVEVPARESAPKTSSVAITEARSLDFEGPVPPAPPPTVVDRSALYELMDDAEECCPTCLEEYTDDNPRIDTKCGHMFHLACIFEWLERSQYCPMCAKKIKFREKDG